MPTIGAAESHRRRDERRLRGLAAGARQPHRPPFEAPQETASAARIAGRSSWASAEAPSAVRWTPSGWNQSVCPALNAFQSAMFMGQRDAAARIWPLIVV